jgi:hypothetical protein
MIGSWFAGTIEAPGQLQVDADGRVYKESGHGLDEGRTRRHLAEEGTVELLGLQHDRVFAPQNTYASDRHRGDQVQEFKAMVKALHAAGIEVILDVVYNHTAEGNHLGPTLSMRGIDNRAYYRSKTTTSGSTPTTPAPATASTSATRTRCS